MCGDTYCDYFTVYTNIELFCCTHETNCYMSIVSQFFKKSNKSSQSTNEGWIVNKQTYLSLTSRLTDEKGHTYVENNIRRNCLIKVQYLLLFIGTSVTENLGAGKKVKQKQTNNPSIFIWPW